MEATARNPLTRPAAIFLVALSLSIGWGIRGNFGHESGAWIPGALAAMAVCLLSGREDWRRRVGYFALFGGLGLGFGGSISYMHTVSYTASGQLATTWYGFFAMFLVGGLWCGLGGAGTALPAVADRDRLTKFFQPLCFVLAALVLHKLIAGPVEKFLATSAAEGMDGTWSRHKSPLYWFDSDWTSALIALLGVCLFDLWDRRFAKGHWLVLFLGVGACLGFGVQWLLNEQGWIAPLVKLLVVPLGDLSAINPETGQPFDPGNLLNNWPQFFGDFPEHLGWGLGLMLGGAGYFALFGTWRRDAGLLLYMSLGWLIAFLLMPVLGTIVFQEYGGFRLTPPRSDDWAGITGVFVGMTIYTLRRGLGPVAYAGTVSGILGGLAFATMQFVRAMLIVPGHPYRTPGGTPPQWAHYQSANWHSFLEQSQGFGHGIAIAITMALLWSRVKRQTDDPPVRRWTDVFSIGIVVLFMTYLNLFKSVPEWVAGQTKVVPAVMKMPLISSIELGAMTWFNLAWLAISAAFVGLMIVHTRRRLAIVPATWLGKGQLIYVLLLWIMVIGNFARALPNFTENRLITEWVIFLNASLATFLIVVLPGRSATVLVREPAGYGPLLGRAWLTGLIAAGILLSLYTAGLRAVYGDATVFAPQHSHKRWGAEAAWRITPILKNEKHR